MNMTLKVTGVLIIILAVASFIISSLYLSIPGIILVFCSIMLGLSFFIISNLRERVTYLEAYIGTSVSEPEQKKLRRCVECGESFSISDLRCPECGAE